LGELLDHPHAFRYLVLVPTIMLLVIGMVMVASASMLEGIEKWDDPFHFSFRQIIFLPAGMLFGTAIYLAVTWQGRPRAFEANQAGGIKAIAHWLTSNRVVAFLCSDWGRVIAWFALAFVFALELLTFVPGVGHEMGGNRNWVNLIGDVRIQPAEFGKLALVWWGAAVFAVKSQAKSELVNRPGHLLLPFFAVGILFAALVVVQRDLGTGVVLAAVLMLMLWIAGVPGRILGLIIAPIALVVVAYIVSDPRRVALILAYLNPASDLAGSNYQQASAQLAFARGGWFGVGLNASRQKWSGLPEAHTDYILAVTGEELGLVCVLLVIALFAVLGFAGFQISLRSDIAFFRYASAGITAWILTAAMVNIAVELGMLPVFGVPLPFLSSGGSSLVAVLGGIGLLLACAAELPAARNAPAKKAPKLKVTVIQA
jgi:cell division protein FtsW